MSDSTAVARVWSDFLRTRPDLPANLTYYEAFAFGSRPDSATSLARLVLDGAKTATSEAMRVYEESGQRPPRQGDFSVVLDGNGTPVCVIETREAGILPFNEVDDAFAYDYGEGDRTLTWWRDAMWEYYEADFKARGWAFSPEIPLLCERFRVVFVPDERKGSADDAG